MKAGWFLAAIGAAIAGLAAFFPNLAGAHQNMTHSAPPSAFWERSAEFDFDPPAPGSYRLSLIRPVPDGEVVNSDGRIGLLKDRISGRIVLLSLIYNQCSDHNGCPMATALLYDIFEFSGLDSDIGGNLKMISLSFDPERDTPEAMRAYGDAALNDPDAGKKAPWDFLTTRSEQSLGPILQGFGQTRQRALIAKNTPGKDFTHLLRVFLIDRDGWVRNIYGMGFLDPRLVIADIRTLLAEETGNPASRR